MQFIHKLHIFLRYFVLFMTGKVAVHQKLLATYFCKSLLARQPGKLHHVNTVMWPFFGQALCVCACVLQTSSFTQSKKKNLLILLNLNEPQTTPFSSSLAVWTSCSSADADLKGYNRNRLNSGADLTRGCWKLPEALLISSSAPVISWNDKLRALHSSSSIASCKKTNHLEM